MHDDLKLFTELAEKLIALETNHPVANPIDSQALYTTLDLTLNETPILDDELKHSLIKIIEHTPKTASKFFFNQLFGGRQGKATLGDLLSVMLNNSMYTYKVAGPQVGIEKTILKTICKMIGYSSASDGTFAPGGSMSNYMAMLMARDKYDPESNRKGITKPLIAYTSETSHYSISKNASFIGLGREHVRYIKANSKGEMDTEALEQQIKTDLDKGLLPFFVNATAGTTVMGAFDNVESISKITKQYDLWLHLDGAYCGSVIFSNKYKHLVKGIEHTDSFSLNAHKMLGTPLSCSILVVQDKSHLYRSFSNDADYLYQTDEDDFNPGKTSLQCGRRNDALKFWTLWKSIGTQGLEALVDKQFQLAAQARTYIKQHPDYTLYSFEHSISVCFNYKDIAAETLCTELYKHSKLMVGYGSFGGHTFVRMVTINSVLDSQDIINFFKTIETFYKNRHTNNT